MSLSTFNYTPSFAIRLDERPQTLVTRFGDGYQYTQPDGLRPLLRRYSVRFNARPLTEIQPIVQFLRGTVGVRPFLWTPPAPDSGEGRWIARTWAVSRVSRGPLVTLSAQFEEQ